MLVVIGCLVLVMGLWRFLSVKTNIDLIKDSFIFLILTTIFIFIGMGFGLKMAEWIGDSLPVVVTESKIPIQELSEKPGVWLKEIDTGNRTLYMVQVDGKEQIYSSKKFDDINFSCDGGNSIEIVRVNTGRKLVWLYATAVNTNEMTIHLDESCSTVWYVN